MQPTTVNTGENLVTTATVVRPAALGTIDLLQVYPTDTNNLNFQSFNNILADGFVTNYELLLKNSNSDSKNSKTTKNKLNQNLQSIIKYQIQYPLKKIGDRFNTTLSPIFSARYSPNKNKEEKVET